MKSVLFLILFTAASCCAAQSDCSQQALQAETGKFFAVQKQLSAATSKGTSEDDATAQDITPAIHAQILQMKDALVAYSDRVMNCSSVDVQAGLLEKQIAQSLRANLPEKEGAGVSSGGWGEERSVVVTRPADFSKLLALDYSWNIDCGDDHILLVYEQRDGVWVRRVRWQATEMEAVSDAFGDFFLYKFVAAENGGWRVATAHGHPWCTSRFSGFHMDLLAPGYGQSVTKSVWGLGRGYSRGDGEVKMKAKENSFELRLNAPSMDLEEGFERRVIYHYQVQSGDRVERTGPLGINARGFVEEWLASPWEEMRSVSDAQNLTALKKAHDGFPDMGQKDDDKHYVTHSYAPVRGCAAKSVFQVQFDNQVEITVPGKSGGVTKTLPSMYFKVVESKEGYTMLSADTKPDPSCNGRDLMATKK